MGNQPGFFTDAELLEKFEIKMPRDVESLAERWIVPPFSVLDSKQGRWQTRKRQWLALGIQSELGRGQTLTCGISPDGTSTDDPTKTYTDRARRKRIDSSPGGSPMPAADYKNRQRGDGRGRPLARCFGEDLMKGENKNFAQGQPKINSIYGRKKFAGGTESKSGTSIFDPTLTECCFQWFCKPNGSILDPFAGGSVRGIVAAVSGRNYTGIDLSEKQILANRIQAREICPDNPPTWIVGDAGDVQTLTDGRFDLLFSCPPYGDLERYSDDPQDLSTMDWHDFLEAYRHIIGESCALLRDNRFAVFVVGDVRDRKTGFYRNLPGETISAFQDTGLHLYNHGILLNSLGSLPIRSHKQMKSGRKLGKCHQDILVFCKGNWKRAVAELSNKKIRGVYI